MGHFQDGIHQRLRGVDDPGHAPKYAAAPPRGARDGQWPSTTPAKGHLTPFEVVHSLIRDDLPSTPAPHALVADLAPGTLPA